MPALDAESLHCDQSTARSNFCVAELIVCCFAFALPGASQVKGTLGNNTYTSKYQIYDITYE